MSDDPSVHPFVVSTTTESATPRYIPIIDKSPPRPAPTLAYSWKECNPQAEVLYIRDHNEANLELSKLPHGPQAFGFDLEWKPTFVRGAGENPVALVQLANNEKILLLQVSAMKEFPTNLVQLLGDPLIVKSGVAIQSDAQKLYKDFRVHMHNCVDLSLLARTVDNARWQGKYNSPLGLARLIETYEYRLLGKGKTSRSNWEAALDPLQIEYASNDAHAGYTLYRTLESMKAALPIPPETDWFSFNVISGQLLDAEGYSWHPRNPKYDPGPPPPPRPPRQLIEPWTGDDEGQHSAAVKRPWRQKRKANQDHSNKVRPPQNSYGALMPGASGSGSTYTSSRGGGKNRNLHQYVGNEINRSYGSYNDAVQPSFQARVHGLPANAHPFMNAQSSSVHVDGMGVRQGGSSHNNRRHNRGHRDEIFTHNQPEYPLVHNTCFQPTSTSHGPNRGRGQGRPQRHYPNTGAIDTSQTTTVQLISKDDPTTKL
ncbi:ribonuclease H-like protein [Pholiota conissans]|uniref:3'-5' exonuclease n=1 Tax=Pholiota conissans TaxID=109636 RepID=A0A9P6CPT4_9AGAR|nr:ribonuclease H-like protein [Pholiota conissans]